MAHWEPGAGVTGLQRWGRRSWGCLLTGCWLFDSNSFGLVWAGLGSFGRGRSVVSFREASIIGLYGAAGLGAFGARVGAVAPIRWALGRGRIDAGVGTGRWWRAGVRARASAQTGSAFGGGQLALAPSRWPWRRGGSIRAWERAGGGVLVFVLVLWRRRGLLTVLVCLWWRRAGGLGGAGGAMAAAQWAGSGVLGPRRMGWCFGGAGVSQRPVGGVLVFVLALGSEGGSMRA